MKNREFFRVCMLVSMLFFFAENIAQEATNSVVRTIDDKDLQWGPCPDFMPNGCEIAILHGDPAKKNADVLFKVPANTDIPNHSHTSAERMILVSGEMDVTYEGEETQKLKTGNYAYGPAMKPHRARCGDAGSCVLFIAFEEPLDAIPVQE
ncbi:MAG: cupin domain-containing protein [Salinimicrobium sediminis]|uniref:Cupin domain-containing protein n=1 Tax=Salinimicrobium sediminis TaxID=1343891 RepID=A0A285X4H1_9FLAO|nr:cupin domain-containing protein [Salinimicrobium sediminis]MDX1603091.1 cupin domain-containing protein [Salinimicrobium sediminis]SOC80247.1 Cupin domain-containing protein [Salinimicrobium sediminis]